VTFPLSNFQTINYRKQSIHQMSGFQQQKIGFFGDKVIGNRYRSFAIFLRKAGTSF